VKRGTLKKKNKNLAPEVEKQIALAILKTERIRLSIIVILGIVTFSQAFATEFLVPDSSQGLSWSP